MSKRTPKQKRIPKEVIQKLNAFLQVAGRPHPALVNGQWTKAMCMEWTTQHSQGDVWLQASPNLHEALGRWQKQLGTVLHQISPGLHYAIRRWQEALRANFPELEQAIQHWQRIYLLGLPEAQGSDAQKGRPSYDPRIETMTQEFFATESPELQAQFSALLARLGQPTAFYRDIYNGTPFQTAVLEAETRQFFAKETSQVQTEFETFYKEWKRAGSYYQMTDRSVNPFTPTTLTEVRSLLHGEALIAYKTGPEWDGIPTTIVVAPTTDQFDVLRYEPVAGKDLYNRFSDDDLEQAIEQAIEAIVAELRAIHKQYGIDILGVGGNGVEFVLQRIPEGEAARGLSQRLARICPGFDEDSDDVARGTISLLWE